MEQHRPQGEDVGARVDRRERAHLLGRHVAGCAQDRAGPREGGDGGGARDAQIEDDHAGRIAVDQQQVLRLEIAVHHARRVQGRQAGGDAQGKGAGLGHRQPSALEANAQILAVEPGHDQEGQAVGGAVIDVADHRGVVEAGEQAGLAPESRAGGAVVDVEELEGDRGAGEIVARLPDGAHAARAGAALEDVAVRDAVARAAAAGGRGHAGGRYGVRGMARSLAHRGLNPYAGGGPCLGGRAGGRWGTGITGRGAKCGARGSSARPWG